MSSPEVPKPRYLGSFHNSDGYWYLEGGAITLGELLAQFGDRFTVAELMFWYHNAAKLVKTRDVASGGISLQGTLEQQELLRLTDSKGQLQTTEEHWRGKMSVEKKEMYEAAGNLFWHSVKKPTWDGKDEDDLFQSLERLL